MIGMSGVVVVGAGLVDVGEGWEVYKGVQLVYLRCDRYTAANKSAVPDNCSTLLM